MKAVLAVLTILVSTALRTAAAASQNATATQLLNRCKRNLVNNSFMEDGYSGYWFPTAGGSLAVAQGVRNSQAIRFGNRTSRSDGLAYAAKKLMDPTCLTPGSTYEFSAFFKLYNSTDGSHAACNPKKDCPKVRVIMLDRKKDVVIKKYLSGYALRGDTWNPVGFNRFRQNFTLPDSSSWDGSIKVWKIQVRDFPQAYDLVMDNFRLRKLAVN